MVHEAAQRIDVEALAGRLKKWDARVSKSSLGTGPAEIVVEVAADHSLAALTDLRDDESTAMRRLVDLTAIDWLRGDWLRGDRLGSDWRGDEKAHDSIDGSPARFTIVYQLQSPTSGQYCRVEVALDTDSSEGIDAPMLDSVSNLWPAANWLECEVFDLFGIRFKGHPDLRRVLLDANFDGAPLRKDHPLKLDRPLPFEIES